MTSIDWAEVRQSVERVVGSLHAFADTLRQMDEEDGTNDGP